MPPFLSDKAKESIEGSTSVLENSLSSLVAANLFLLVPLGAPLQQLWEVIRPLQYLSIIALAYIVYPGNLHLFFYHMVDISSLDVLFGLPITEYFFSFR